MLIAQWRKSAAALSAAVLLGAVPVTCLAVEHSHHSHGHEAHAQLALDNGKKWDTDDNLRHAMERIRDALAAELPAIHSGKATAQQYNALAQKTNDQIAFMVKNCKLKLKADAMLHLVLADLIAGADSMAAQEGKAARKGAEKIAETLEKYDAYFNHPGWHGAHHAH